MPRALSSPKQRLRDCYLLQGPAESGKPRGLRWATTSRHMGGALPRLQGQVGAGPGLGARLLFPGSCLLSAASAGMWTPQCGLQGQTPGLSPRSPEKLTKHPSCLHIPPRAQPASDSLASQIPHGQAGQAPGGDVPTLPMSNGAEPVRAQGSRLLVWCSFGEVSQQWQGLPRTLEGTPAVGGGMGCRVHSLGESLGMGEQGPKGHPAFCRKEGQRRRGVATPRAGVSQTEGQPFQTREPGTCPPSVWARLRVQTPTGKGPSWSCALLWPSWESRVHWCPGVACEQVWGRCLPNPCEEGQSLSLKGLLDALPEASMDWASTRKVPSFRKAEHRTGAGEERRRQRGARQRGAGGEGSQQGPMLGNPHSILSNQLQEVRMAIPTLQIRKLSLAEVGRLAHGCQQQHLDSNQILCDSRAHALPRLRIMQT